MAFKNPPDSLRVEGKNSSVTKTHLGRIRESSRLLFQLAAGTVDMDAALRFAESRLRGNPQDAELLETYVSVSQSFQQDQRVDDFLASRLWIPPISIPWHRTYHNLEQSAPREARLAQEYDARLKESPSDAGLLYLRGRVASDSREARKYFEKSIEIDPDLDHGPAVDDLVRVAPAVLRVEVLTARSPDGHALGVLGRVVGESAAGIVLDLVARLPAVVIVVAQGCQESSSVPESSPSTALISITPRVAASQTRPYCDFPRVSIDAHHHMVTNQPWVPVKEH